MPVTGPSSVRCRRTIRKGQWTPIHSEIHCKSVWTRAVSDWSSCWTKFRPNWNGWFAYLDTVTVQDLAIDLITLRMYEINGTRVALPQRVSPDLRTRSADVGPGKSRSAASKGDLSEGSDAFRTTIAGATKEDREVFEQLIAWAEKLADLPNVRLSTNSYPETKNLLPQVMPDNKCLAYIANYKNKPSVYAYRSVMERLAPNSIEHVEKASGKTIRSGTRVPIEPHVLEALDSAYREASGH